MTEALGFIPSTETKKRKEAEEEAVQLAHARNTNLIYVYTLIHISHRPERLVTRGVGKDLIRYKSHNFHF